MKNKMAIVVSSFDGYSDLWDNFFLCFNKFWKDCPYQVYLINNFLKPEILNIHILNTGKEIDWKNRMLKSLNSIKEEYILLMLEDYFIGEQVNNDIINEILIEMVEKDFKMYKITNLPKGTGKVKGKEYLSPIFKDERYGINLQCAIWKKKELIESIKKINSSAWDFEEYFLKETKLAKHEPIAGYYVDNREVIKIYNGVLKGKYIRATLKYFKSKGIVLNMKNRERLSFKEEIIHTLKSRISKILNNKQKRLLKKILRRLGFKFTTKY